MPHADVWDRARHGRHTVLIGIPLAAPPQDLRVVRVSCDVPPSTLGPLLEAKSRIESVLGARAPLAQLARSGVTTLRRHLLGDLATTTSERAFIDVCNRLAALGPAALVLEGVESASPATHETLQHILEKQGRLSLPLVLVMREPPRSPSAIALVDAVRRCCGDEAIVTAPADAAPLQASSRQAEPMIDLRALPAHVVRVLRALSVAGSGCEAKTLAALLDATELDVLDAMQSAADAGVPVEDRGEGRLFVAEPALSAIRAATLPSFAAAMHRRLAGVLAESMPPPPPDPFVPDGEAPPRPGDAFDVLQADPPDVDTRTAVPPTAPVAPASAVETDRHSEANIGAARAPDPVCAPPPIGDVFAPVVRPSPRVGDPSQPTRDDARSARHLEAAGDEDAALGRYLDAMDRAAGSASYTKALAHADAALDLLRRLPDSDARRQQRAAVLIARARVQWHGAGPLASFSLPAALAVAEAARAALHVGDPSDLVADVAVTIAGILYDLGDAESLARAERELGIATRGLSAAGRALDATRLFNDQANVLIRIGDPVRAAHLLTESRKVFEPKAKVDATAMAEMAETDHLFARVLLKVPARPGREADALSLSLDHAIAAERAFGRLGAPREAARVRETMGRVELARGRLDRAAEQLGAALRIQEPLGDVVGLARSTAALSDVFAREGKTTEALTLLGDSIALNAEKASPLGLAFNRQALETQFPRDRATDERLRAAVEARLVAAEQKVGRLSV